MKRIHTALLAALMGTLLLGGCERPSQQTTQTGFRGVAMGQVINPRIAGPIEAAQKLPDPVPAIPSPPGSPLAKDTFKNVQVLGDLPAGEFTRTMLAITAWVAPKEGCAYCHKAGDELSADSLYTKVVARKMIQMTRHINNDWKTHVAARGPDGAGGVTCYTCHRGAPVPAKVWFTDPGPKQPGGTTAQSGGQNHPSVAAAYSSLGLDPLTPYLLGNERIRGAGTTALPTGNKASIRQTENTFALMMHMSQSLGVNCTHCHNTRSLAEWAESPLTRTTAFYGIRMARDLNNAYMLPLTATFPANRLGPTGDVAKVSCATCHQGLSRPLNGAQLIKDHPALGGALVAAAETTTVPTDAVATVSTKPPKPAKR
jgi:photosynthetic reaction center cytochrome c subunit